MLGGRSARVGQVGTADVCVCVTAGNHTAAAYVYDTRTGCQVTRVEAIRVQGHVRACGLSEDCR
jgi:hypothetical protein